MSGNLFRRAVAGAATGAMVCGAIVLLPTAAHADSPVQPGNEGDVGVYTDGVSDVMDIGDPTYTNVAAVQAALNPGVPFTADSMYQSIFDQDLANGGTDYYLDRVLGVSGNSSNNVLQTRGRSLYMRGSSSQNFSRMGFAGTAFAGGPNNLGALYTVTVPGETLTEVGAARFNAPSHAKAQYNVGATGVVAELKKFITYDNVAVTAITFNNPGAEDVSLTVNAASALATSTTESEDELTGTRNLTSGANNGLIDTAWSRITVGLKASGFAVNGTSLERAITVPAGGSVDLSVVGVLYTDTLPDSRAAFYDYAEMTPATAFQTAVTAFNERWASDIPYIDVPDPAVEKAIVYRWWGERYNSLDANESGYVYQYPTTIEGVNLYQNAIALTQPMHLQDTKWIRNPYLAYGQILNIGELSGSSAFLDSPGHTSWNNHYSQYIGTAGLEAYNVHGGGADIADRFAYYFESDGKGQLEHYDGNGDNLIAYDANYMPGNDADAISFGFPKATATAPGARTIERPESAYVWGDFDAARQLYAIAGADGAKVTEMATQADDIQSAILGRLWSEETRMFLAGTSHGATSADTSNGNANPLSAAERDLIPAKESNLYDVYAENVIPKDQWETYVDGYRFLRYGDNFPIFPFYTANQYDRTKFGIGGSNNFSNINFTVQYRGVRSGLRYYDPEHQYVTPEYASKLLDWMVWSTYPGGNLLQPNQAEYYSNWNAAAGTFNRNNPNHVMLGNMNYIFVEDMGGLLPRSDDSIELWPIDLGYDHFMVNNLRYHGNDVTIVWDPDGSVYGLGAGYSLFIDGAKKVSADALGRFVYDPNTNTVVEHADGLTVTVGAGVTDFPAAVDTPIDDARVVAYLKTAGIDLEEDAVNLAAGAELSSSYTQEGTRPTPWRNFHTPGYVAGSMNYTPGAIATTERPVSLAAVTDGQTVNEPYWGNYGTTEPGGYVELDLGASVAFDNVKVWFVSDRQAGGYHQPSRYSVQVPDGAGGWTIVPSFKSPSIVGPKFNEALFPTVTADKVRITFSNAPTFYTAISEIQVFDSGRDIPAIVNGPPVVTVVADASTDGNLSTVLAATATDDGVPETGDLSYGWEVVSTPIGGSVIFADAGALSTRVTGTVAGDYTFRFWASDGELRTEKEITVALSEKVTSAEFGASATITTSGTASWENHTRVNQPTTPASSNPGTGQGWGNWGMPFNGTSVAKEAWIQYAWASPMLLKSTDIYWYDDNGGTRMPTATTYAIEYSANGTDWTPVALQEGSTYAGGLVRNTYNHFEFEAVSAQYLRIRIWGLQGAGAGTGVVRWRANGDTIASVAEPVIMRTPTGVVPTLPTSLDVVYSGGTHGAVDFLWQEITPAMVAETNVEPFVVYGTNSTYGLIVEAQIYVRPETSIGGISIQGAETFEETVQVGELPYLPTKVAVSYNDGSRDNQAIGVEWAFDDAVMPTAGVYVIRGDLILPEYVSTAGVTSTTLTLTFLGSDTTAPVVSVSASPELVDGGWADGNVTLTATATDDRPSSGGSVIEVRIGDGEWAAYTAPVVVTGEGDHTLGFRATDAAGNVSELVAQVVRIDLTAPAVTASVDGRVVTITATDPESGVELVEYRLDEGAWLTYTGPVTVGDAAVTVWFRATDVAGNVSAEASVDVAAVEPEPEVPDFADVVEGQVFYDEIRWLAEAGLSRGTVIGDATYFYPASPVSRQAMAAFVYRYMDADFTPEPGTQTFSDVTPEHPFYVEIEWMHAQGLTDGYADGSFGATRPVSRQAMAAFLHRLAGSPDAAGAAEFTDVPAGHPFGEAISWLAESMIADGYADGSFGTTRPVSRQAMAAFLYRYDAFTAE